MEQEGSGVQSEVPRRTVFYSSQAAGYLDELPRLTAFGVMVSLEEKLWQAQLSRTILPGWRPISSKQRDYGPGCYIIKGRGKGAKDPKSKKIKGKGARFGALVQCSGDIGEPIRVLRLAPNAQSLKV